MALYMKLDRQAIASELERQGLIEECHRLIALIAQSPYSIRLLKAARDGLLLYAGYKTKTTRQQRFVGAEAIEVPEP